MTPTFTINTVIALYEEEESNLKKLISNSLEEEEFLIAKYHTTALHIIRQKLFKLNCLHDSGYQQKHHSKMRLSNMTKMLSSDKYADFKDSLINHIEEETLKLNQLNLIGSIKENLGDADLTKRYIIDLLKNHIQGLTIVIDQKNELKLKFFIKGKRLKITIPEIKKVLPEFLENNYYAVEFTKLGFQFSQNKLILSLNIDNDVDSFASTIMQTLSIICIDIFDVAINKFDSFLIIENMEDL